jgi:hypothetical protein
MLITVFGSIITRKQTVVERKGCFLVDYALGLNDTEHFKFSPKQIFSSINTFKFGFSLCFQVQFSRRDFPLLTFHMAPKVLSKYVMNNRTHKIVNLLLLTG